MVTQLKTLVISMNSSSFRRGKLALTAWGLVSKLELSPSFQLKYRLGLSSKNDYLFFASDIQANLIINKCLLCLSTENCAHEYQSFLVLVV